jgi:crotonobetaine/carnitine-CoA ligase
MGVDPVAGLSKEESNHPAGEKTLVAAVVATQGSDFDEQELRQFCSKNLEKNDIPEIFQKLTAIPKTVSEKPIEKECIALLGKIH